MSSGGLVQSRSVLRGTNNTRPPAANFFSASSQELVTRTSGARVSGHRCTSAKTRLAHVCRIDPKVPLVLKISHATHRPRDVIFRSRRRTMRRARLLPSACTLPACNFARSDRNLAQGNVLSDREVVCGPFALCSRFDRDHQSSKQPWRFHRLGAIVRNFDINVERIGGCENALPQTRQRHSGVAELLELFRV